MIQNDLRDTLQTIANSVGDLYSRVAQLEASPFSVVSGGGGGAPDNAQYLTLALNANLTQERRFVPAARLSATDSGANADYTLDLASSGVVAAAYGSATQVPTFTVDAYGRLTVAANVAISGVPPVVHNVLDSTYHGDVLTGAITRGDLLYGNATPKIARLPIGGITGSIITRDATDVLWSTYALAGTAGQTYTFPTAGGTLPGGSGAASYVAYWSGANTLTGAATFTYQTGASPNLTVQAANAAHVPLVVKAAGSQTADLVQWQNSSGTVLGGLTAGGSLAVGASPSAAYKFYLSDTKTDTSSIVYSAYINTTAAPSTDSSASFYGMYILNQSSGTAALTGGLYGLRFYAYHNNTSTSGTLDLFGIYGSARQNNTGAMGNVYGGYFIADTASAGSGALSGIYGARTIAQPASSQNISIVSGSDISSRPTSTYSGTITGLYGLRVATWGNASTAGGVVTNAYGIRILSPTVTGTVTNAYALYVDSISGAGTNNYAIYTGAGLVRFGDDVVLADGKNLQLATTTGTKIATATSQKLGFWNAAPVVQPTTAGSAATFVQNSGNAVNDASTFDGYTLAQVVKALRTIGVLA